MRDIKRQILHLFRTLGRVQPEIAAAKAVPQHRVRHVLLRGDGGLKQLGLPRADLEAWAPRPALRVVAPRRRVFCVHYRFLSCGTVFHDGLREAADALGYASEHADWDDPRLAQKVERFRPDLLFVVHGRRFVRRWESLLSPGRPWCSAVWLLDEPYEVDDTAAWSGRFDRVFVYMSGDNLLKAGDA